MHNRLVPTPSHLLFGRRIRQVPHAPNKPKQLEDPMQPMLMTVL